MLFKCDNEFCGTLSGFSSPGWDCVSRGVGGPPLREVSAACGIAHEPVLVRWFRRANRSFCGGKLGGRLAPIVLDERPDSYVGLDGSFWPYFAGEGDGAGDDRQSVLHRFLFVSCGKQRRGMNGTNPVHFNATPQGLARQTRDVRRRVHDAPDLAPARGCRADEFRAFAFNHSVQGP